MNPEDDRPVPVITETYLSAKPPRSGATAALLSVAIIFCASSIYWENHFDLASSLEAERSAVFTGHQYWRLFAAVLIHADPSHAFSNAIPLALFSYLLYGYFGFLVHPLLSYFLAVGVHTISLATYPAGVSLIGASGMIYVMLAFWLILYLLTEKRHSIGKRILRSTGFLLLVVFSSAFDPQTSYRTHFLGLFSGALAGAAYYYSQKDFFHRFEQTSLE